jgi:hypothetical protein
MALAKHLVLLAALAACGKGGGSRPKLTTDLIPPGAQPLMLGKSVEADVMAKATAPDAAPTVSKDKSFGGEGVVQFNEHKLISITDKNGSTYDLWTMGEGPPKLGKLYLKSDGCPWVADHIAKLDGAKNCPGNRKTGMSGTVGYFCLTADDGHVVHVECSEKTIEYWLSDKT